jgi:hypothetical protein
MASDGSAGAITSVNPVIGIQPSAGKAVPQSGKTTVAPAAVIPAGNVLPQSGKTVTIVAASTPATTSKTSTPAANDATAFKGTSVVSSTTGTTGTAAKSAFVSRSEPQTLVDQVNKYLNDSGRPDEFRVDPNSSSYIQQVNPATGAVIAEYSVSEFPALARSVGASGLLIDYTA